MGERQQDALQPEQQPDKTTTANGDVSQESIDQHLKAEVRVNLICAAQDGRLQESLQGTQCGAQSMEPTTPQGDAAAATMPPVEYKVDLEESGTAAVSYEPKADLLLRAVGVAGVPGPRPTQCQVDAGQQELRLLSLGPVGTPKAVPFDGIVNV